MTRDTVADVVIVGAGIAGLACARQLQRQRWNVVVLEKSRGVGGRVATRRIEAPSSVMVDHGCQYLTADTDGFHRFLKEQQALGTVVEWTRTLYTLDHQGLHPDPLDDHRPRYVCPEGMTALAKHLGDGIPIHLETHVSHIEAADTWQIHTTQGDVWAARSLVLALPAPQILPLIAPWIGTYPAFATLLESATYTPCLSVMAGYAPPEAVPTWKGMRCVGDPYLSWVALDSSKRVDSRDPVLVIQSTATFAQQYLEATAEDLQQAAQILLKQVGQRLDPWMATPLWHQIHRWRYALPEETVGLTSLATTSPLPLICAGDWCAGSRVEGAWLSGLDAAAQLQHLMLTKKLGA
ncbi:MAG: FAD-dependent oxidoreductase [Synechococcales cyanobacterium]